MATENPTTRTNRTRVMTDTWVKGKGSLAGLEWADEPSPGLRLRVSAQGKKTFFYRYKFDGKTKKITIGSYPATSLQDAREAWRELSTLRNKGINPKTHLTGQAEQAQQAKVEETNRQSATVARLVADYIGHISKDRKTWRVIEGILRNHLDPYMAWQADQLKRGDVLTVLKKLIDDDKPVMHNRTKQAIHAAYNWAIRSNWQQGVLETNPAFKVESLTETARDRALSNTELRKVLTALSTSGIAELYRDVLMLILLTGCRSNEVCSMQWKHIHDDEWRLPGELTKNSRQHVVYLSRQALAILKKYQGGTYVFTNPDSARGYVHKDTISLGLRRALGVNRHVIAENRQNRLGVEPFVVHDLRRTLATWLGENQVDERIHDRILNHYKKTIASIYNTAKYNRPAREWWTNWGNHIQALSADNVIPLKKKDA